MGEGNTLADLSPADNTHHYSHLEEGHHDGPPLGGERIKVKPLEHAGTCTSSVPDKGNFESDHLSEFKCNGKCTNSGVHGGIEAVIKIRWILLIAT